MPSNGSISKKTDHQRILAAVVAVADVFNRGLSDVALRLYAEALSQWPAAAIEGCVGDMLRAVRFFPAASEWGEYASEWLKQEHVRQREARRALPETGTYSEQERTAQIAAAKAMRDELAAKLGWGRPKAEAQAKT